MAHCYQLSINEREEISLGLAQGLSKNYIALSLGRSSSTICREVNRNTANRQAYRAVKAQGRANKLMHLARKSRKMDINLPLRHYVLEHLDQLWSPEQIAKRLKILYPENINKTEIKQGHIPFSWIIDILLLNYIDREGVPSQ